MLLENILQKNSYHLGLLGKNIAHSKSPEIYKSILGAGTLYTLLDYQSESLIPSLSEIFLKLDGLSITSPYKTHFLAKVNTDMRIKKLKAINCIRKNSDGLFEGTNTDFSACLELLPKYLDLSKYCKVIIFGNGAMSRVILSCLEILKITDYEHLYRSKNGDISLLDLKARGPVFLINSCSREFLFAGQMHCQSTFWNLNYNAQEQSNHLSKVGVNYFDGYELLHLQAMHALCFWNIRQA